MTFASLVGSRPLGIMAVAVLLRLLVPMLAKIAGNRDPMENSISHVFGQGSICVAMDFPGWLQAAGVFFAISGIMDGFAMFKIYQIASQDRERGAVLGFRCFLMVVAVAYNLFWLVTVFNPVTNPDPQTVFWHTIPYVVLQLARIMFVTFLLAFLPPADVSRRLRVGWYCMGIVNVSSYIVGVVSIVWSLRELNASGIAHLIDEPNEFPFERYKVFALNEYLFTLSHILTLSMHPLAWRGHTEKEACGRADKQASVDA